MILPTSKPPTVDRLQDLHLHPGTELWRPLYHPAGQYTLSPGTIHTFHRALSAVRKSFCCDGATLTCPVKYRTYTSLMIADGTPLVNMSHSLGHIQVSTSTNIYTHAIAEARAAQVFDRFGNDVAKLTPMPENVGKQKKKATGE